jgi:hypothetical protein
VPLGPFLRSNGRSEGRWFFSWCDAADNVGTFGRRTHARVKTVLPSPQQLRQYLSWSIYWPAEIQVVMQSAGKVMVRALRQGEAVCDRKLCKELAACRNSVGERCYLSMCSVCVERLRTSFILEGAACIVPLVQRRKFPISWLCADLPGQRYQLGDLRKIDFPSLNRRIRRQYLQAGLPLVISGVHLALVEIVIRTPNRFGRPELSALLLAWRNASFRTQSGTCTRSSRWRELV